MKNIRIFIVLLLLHMCFVADAQYIFSRNDSITVSDGSVIMANPWAGGLNFTQFSSIDLNLDGKKDLLVFDRSGNVSLTFINTGSTGISLYIHDFKTQKQLPKLHDWALSADYNCDGKNDIFSYSTGGFNIYKNTSTVSNTPYFQLLTETIPYTHTSALGNYINLYVSSVDIPAIIDIDNDGDLDVLTFDVFGRNVEYHQNLSIDSFGVCDSIRYLMSNMCWGHFVENFADNSVILFDTCGTNVSNPKSAEAHQYATNIAMATSDDYRSSHSGSTVLSLDVDGNGVKDLVLGDVSFPSMVLLVNGGDTVNKNTSMISQDTAFPENNASTIPVDLPVFPAAYYLDIDNDGVRDLICTPNSPNTSQNFESVWYYHNIGNDSIPDFTFVQPNFLQDGMIEVGEGAYPVLFDYDADGLYDLIIANYGKYASGGNYSSGLTLYRNSGTATSPAFTFITDDYMGLSSAGMGQAVYPAFGDLDGDGDKDLFCGTWDGKLHYFENTAGAGNPSVFSLTQPNYTDNIGAIIDVGELSTPQLFDIDRDGDLDLLVGERRGKINYYRNVGTTTTPSFELRDDSLGNVFANTYNESYGYSVPYFFEDSSSYRLFLGTHSGYLKYYENIDGNINGTFTLIDSAYGGIWEGKQSAVVVADLNNDSVLDMLYGNYRGGLAYYNGVKHNSNSITSNFLHGDFSVYPNPTSGDVTIKISNFFDGLIVTLSDPIGRTVLKENITSATTTLPTKNLRAGIYFICVAADVGRVVKKLIIY